MAGLTALNNIVRQRAAFGGIMGRDGRRQYGGGSDMGKDKDSTDKSKGGYQGGPQGGYGDAGSDDNPSGDVYEERRNEFEYEVGKKALRRPGDKEHLKNKTIPNANSLYYTGVPKSNIPYLGKYLNMAAPFRNNMLRGNIDYFLSQDRKNIDRNQYPDTLQGYKDYMSDRLSGVIDASGNPINNTDSSFSGLESNNDRALLPVEDVKEEGPEYRFGDNEFGAEDVTQGYYAANGGRVPRAFGGIMDTATGRKAYGLGSIFKSIKKAAGKVLKSPLGKAAIAGAMFYYGGGGRMPFTEAFKAKGFGGAKLFGEGSFLSKSNPLFFSEGKFNPFKASGLLTLGGALMGPAKQDQMPGDGDRGGSLIDPLTGKEAKPAEMRASLNEALDSAGGDPDKIKAIQDAYAFLGPDQRLGTYLPYETYGVKDGGRIRAQEGGLMNLGGMEKDYRAEGGFVPIGKQEKADDVPARLSVNEFVFTADAVRNAGGGDIDKGAEVMENMMKNLENGGTVSEESQGNTGAQNMFSVSERIGEVI